MSFQQHHRPVNPRLGTHYAIFASAIVAVVLILAMLEQLGARRLWLSHVMIAAPIVFCLCIAALGRTLDVHEFFAAGRRIPAVFGGLSLAATAIGGTGFFALTGCLYLIGFDALALAIGWGAGFAIMAVAFIPYLRKSGAYTLPGFFRQRFDSRIVGAVAGVLLIPAMMLLLAAELRMGSFVAALFASLSFEMAVTAGTAVVAVIAILGGMRSVAWSQCAQYLVILGAFLLPLTMVSVQVTNLPVPQLTYGMLFERIASQEVVIGARQTAPSDLSEALPGERPEPAMKPFLYPFGELSMTDFILLLLCFMAGTAAMPSLLMRAGTAPNLFQARRAIGWGVVFFGLFLISAPAYAAFAKFLTLREMVGTLPSQFPDWIGGLTSAGLIDFSDKNNDGVIAASEMLVSRDGVTLALPIMAEFPFVVAVLVAAGGITAAIAACTAHVLAVAATVSDDLFRGLVYPGATPAKRLIVARLAIIAIIVPTGWFVAYNDFDILPAAAWAMSLAGATFLPSLSLAIWWPRMTVWGVLAALMAGFGVAASQIGLTALAGTEPWLGVSDLLAGIFGIPAGFLAGIAVSLLTARPAGEVAARAVEIRDPTGETVHDRAARSAAQAAAGTALGHEAVQGG